MEQGWRGGQENKRSDTYMYIIEGEGEEEETEGRSGRQEGGGWKRSKRE